MLLARLLQNDYRVVLLESNPDRVAQIRSIDPPLECRRTTDETFAAVFETGGTAGSADLAVNLLAPGGTAVFVGLSQSPLKLTPFQIARRALTIRGSIIYDHEIDFPASLTWLSRHGTSSLMPTRSFAFENVPEAFESLAQGDTVKAIITMEGTVE